MTRLKIPILTSAVLLIVGILPAIMAADYSDWVAKGYRWSLVSGLHAYISKDDAKNERSGRERKSVSEAIRYAYYLRPGKVVLVIGTDTANGLSRIRMGGIASDLWTATKNLSTRPVKNSVGKLETPEMAGVLPIAEATPKLSPSIKPAATVRPSPSGRPSK
jgi:hypothetical protein